VEREERSVCSGFAKGMRGRRATDAATEVRPIDIKVETRAVGEWTVLDVEGEVDVFTAPKLREAIIGALDDGKDRLIVNLEKVAFMDSTGLGVLVGGLKRVKEKNGELAIAGAQGTVLRVLNVTGLNAVFSMRDSVDAATSR
jgi:anti-sigma B factor antagonist